MRRLATPKWLLTHALVIGAVATFVVLGLWQLRRGEAGNLRSYGYALEWPSFALLTIGFWAKIVRDEVHPKQDAASVGGAPPANADDGRAVAARRAAPMSPARAARAAEQAELDTYNRYLAERAQQRTAP